MSRAFLMYLAGFMTFNALAAEKPASFFVSAVFAGACLVVAYLED